MGEVNIEALTSLRAELVELRAGGVRTLRHQNGQEVTYKGDSEMAHAIAALDAEIARLSRPSPGAIRFQTSKGI